MARIMVVEDEPITAADLEQKLIALGHDVTAWSDTGEDALLQARTSAPDLVLMDIRLRGAMTGIETARKLREQSDTPVVFLTAFADPATIDQACETHPYGYLLKPFTEQAVASAVQVALTRARVERASSERERWVTAALQGAGEGLIAVDSQGLVRFINDHASSLLGVKADTVIGERGDAVLRFEASEAGDPLAAALVHGRITSAPSRALIRSSGARVPVAYSAAPVVVAGTTKAGAIVVFREAPPPARAPDQTHLEALSTLSRQLSHEINNPLTYNLGAVHLALKELDELRAMSAITGPTASAAARQHEQHLARIGGFLRTAEEGASRVADVVRELGTFALAKPDLSPVRPSEVLDLATGLSEASLPDDVRLVRQVDSAPMVRANKWQLARVLSFAIDHVLEALPARGAIVLLTLSTDPRGRAVFHVAARKDPALPESARREPLPVRAPATPRASSVSVTLVQQIIEAQRGELHVDDTSEGRSVDVVLPPMELAPSDPQVRPGESRRGSILVIDDEPMIGRVLSISLEPEHDVTAVCSAESALALLEAGDAFDVILCDLSMPGMNGQDFFEHLRASRPELASRVIFMSGGPTSETLRRFLHLQQDRYISKPFQTDKLLRVIADCIVARARSGTHAQC